MIRHETIGIALYAFAEWSCFKGCDSFFRPFRIIENWSPILDTNDNAENLIWIGVYRLCQANIFSSLYSHENF